MNLIALEFRKHRVLWALLLLAALLWVSWMIRLATASSQLGALAANMGFLAVLAPAGLLAPVALARSLNSEARGPLAFLLTSPRSGWLHVGIRFFAAFIGLGLYYALLLGLSAWLFGRSGVDFQPWLAVAVWGYGMAALAAPTIMLALVYGLLSAAYRPGKAGQIVAVAGFFGAVGSWSWLVSEAMKLDWLPLLKAPHVVVSASLMRYFGWGRDSLDLQPMFESVFKGVPTAPLFVGVLVFVVFYLAAAYIWEEVEWA